VDLVSCIFVPGIRLLLCSAWVGRDQDKQGRKGEDRSGQADHGQRFGSINKNSILISVFSSSECLSPCQHSFLSDPITVPRGEQLAEWEDRLSIRKGLLDLARQCDAVAEVLTAA
jgi:hypothetical protein